MKRLLLSVALLLAMASGCRRNAVQDNLDKAKDAVYQHHPNEALQWYHAALEQLENDETPEAQVYRARALRGAGDTYYLELGDAKRAVGTYRELIQLCPEAPETLGARLHLADLLRREYRDLRGAITELNQALARNPPQSAELSYQVATMYFELGDYQQCELEAANLARKYETSQFVDDALMLRGQSLSMMEGRREPAMRAFQEVVDRFPDSSLQPHALFEIGKLRADNGEPEKAIEVWIEALKRHPEPQVVQTVIARVRKQMRATAPIAINDAVKAFDRDVPGSFMGAKKPKTSIEAVGGSADEAAAEASMKGEAVPHAPAKPPAPAEAPTPAE